MDRIKSDQVKRDNIGYLDNILSRYERTKDVTEMFQESRRRSGVEVQEEVSIAVTSIAIASIGLAGIALAKKFLD